MKKGFKIRVRKTPNGWHLYVAHVKGMATYGWGGTAQEARQMLQSKIDQGPTI